VSIFKRPGSPYWQSEVKIGGIRSCRSSKTASRREAEAFDRQHRAEIAAKAKAQKGRPKQQEMTLDEACGRYWIERGSKLGWAEHVARHLRWIAGSAGTMPLSAVANDTVAAIARDRQAAGAGAAGINRTLAVLRQVMGSALRSWGIPIQPIDWKAHWQKEPKGRTRWLTPEEARRLCDALPERVRLAVEWSLYTGTRKSETYGLRWCDVDLERNQARIVKGKTRHCVANAPAVPTVIHSPSQFQHAMRHVSDVIANMSHGMLATKNMNLEAYVMSKVDYERLEGYEVTIEEVLSVSEVLAKLKEDLAAEEAAHKRAALAIQQLRVAISAIERDMATSESAKRNQRPSRKRGDLSRAILDAVREGVGSVGLLEKRLDERGIKTTRASISNAIQRLQRSKLIIHDISKGIWVIREEKKSPPAAEAAE
jgi:integrase